MFEVGAGVGGGGFPRSFILQVLDQLWVVEVVKKRGAERKKVISYEASAPPQVISVNVLELKRDEKIVIPILPFLHKASTRNASSSTDRVLLAVIIVSAL